jgi:hypothetical protein
VCLCLNTKLRKTLNGGSSTPRQFGREENEIEVKLVSFWLTGYHAVPNSW